MSSPKIIFSVLLYVCFLSTAVAVFAVGLGAEGFDVNQSMNIVNYSPPSQEDSIFSGIPILGTGEAASSFIQSLAFTILGVLFWTIPESIFPLWANIIFIKIPLVYLVASIIEVLLP